MSCTFIATFGSTGLGSPIGIGFACPAEGLQGSVEVEPEGVSLFIAVYRCIFYPCTCIEILNITVENNPRN